MIKMHASYFNAILFPYSKRRFMIRLSLCVTHAQTCSNSVYDTLCQFSDGFDMHYTFICSDPLLNVNGPFQLAQRTVCRPPHLYSFFLFFPPSGLSTSERWRPSVAQ